MASRKRLFEELDTLECAKKTTKAAKIHGVLTSLSPMKASNYFEGRIADNTKSMRLVGFDTVKQRDLATHHDNNQAVCLENCNIQKSKYSDEMEVVVTKSTLVGDSPRKYPKVVTPTATSSSITLDQLQGLKNYQRVTVVIKVLRADAKVEVKPGLFKQDLCVSDATGTARLTVWQDTINTLNVEESYKLDNLMVCSFDNQKYLTPPKSGSTITPHEDIVQSRMNPTLKIRIA